MKKFLIPLTLLLICAFVITGCNSSNTSTSAAAASSNPPPKSAAASASASASPAAQPQYGGTLKIILGFGFGTNIGNPVVTGMNPITSFWAPPCGESLTEFDSKGNVVPLLAESWDMDPVAKTMTFHLRKGIKFHDGTDFNAEAVKWNWDVRIARGAITGGENVQSIDVVDNNTVKVTYKVYSALNLISMTHVQFMYSPTAVKTHGDDWAKLHPVGDRNRSK